MKRIIKFSKTEGRYDVPSFTLCDNQGLTLDIVAPLSQNGTYYLTAKHGIQKKRVVLAGRMSVSFSPEWLLAGGLEPLMCELELRDKSGVNLYKKYIAEPLEFNKVDVGIKCLASVQQLEASYNALKEEFLYMKNEFNVLKETIANIPSQIEEAKKEAIIEAAGGDPMGA